MPNLPCYGGAEWTDWKAGTALPGGRRDGLASHTFGSIKIAPHRLDVSLGFI